MDNFYYNMKISYLLFTAILFVALLEPSSHYLLTYLHTYLLPIIPMWHIGQQRNISSKTSVIRTQFLLIQTIIMYMYFLKQIKGASF